MVSSSSLHLLSFRNVVRQPIHSSHASVDVPDLSSPNRTERTATRLAPTRLSHGILHSSSEQTRPVRYNSEARYLTKSQPVECACNMRLALNLLLVAAIVAALAGGVVLLVRDSGDGAMQITLATPGPAADGEVKVHVTGAVNAPGVYTVRDGARISDALEMAGGPTPDADLEAVNLARRVRDEDQVVVPREGEAAQVAAASGSVTSQGARVDLNAADAQTLEGLPGIGPVKAQAIIRHREQNGGFTRVEDLLEVSGIGQATFSGIIDLVEVR